MRPKRLEFDDANMFCKDSAEYDSYLEEYPKLTKLDSSVYLGDDLNKQSGQALIYNTRLADQLVTIYHGKMIMVHEREEFEMITSQCNKTQADDTLNEKCHCTSRDYRFKVIEL